VAGDDLATITSSGAPRILPGSAIILVSSLVNPLGSNSPTLATTLNAIGFAKISPFGRDDGSGWFSDSASGESLSTCSISSRVPRHPAPLTAW
jgi:hypothetical protein